MNLARFPRVRLGYLSIPIEPMPNLGKVLSGTCLCIKPDDCTGLSTGGNKCDHPRLDDIVNRDDVEANRGYIGDGYAYQRKSMVDAVRQLAYLGGILLDSVYSGKAMAGLIDLIRRGHFKADSDVIFLHTGGSAALFGYPDAFDLPGYVD